MTENRTDACDICGDPIDDHIELGVASEPVHICPDAIIQVKNPAEEGDNE